jgi:hypothetical protein
MGDADELLTEERVPRRRPIPPISRFGLELKWC